MRGQCAVVFGLVGALACVGARPTTSEVETTPGVTAEPAAAQLSAEGPGWRLRGDMFESVHEGVRLRLPPGWRLEPRVRVDDPMAFTGFGLMNDEHAIALVVRRPSSVSASEDRLREVCAETYLSLANETAPPLVAELDGERLEFTAGKGVNHEYLHALTFRGGQPLEFRLRYPTTSNRELVRELARSALATLELLAPAERAALRAELERSPSRWDLLGTDRALRGATFHDFAFGVRVNIPSSVMEVTLEPAPGDEGVDVKRRIAFEDRGRDLHAALMAAELPYDMRFTAQEWHDLAMLELSIVSSHELRVSTQAQRFGDAEALVTRAESAQIGLRIHLATVVDDHRGLIFLVRKGTRTVAATSDEIEEMLAAFEVVNGLERARMDGNRYIDAQSGYAIEGLLASDADTHFHESPGVFQTMTVWTTEETAIGVLAHNYAPDAGSMQTHLRDKIAEIGALNPLCCGRWLNLFDPVRGRRLTWEQAGMEHTFALFVRDRTIYELHVQSSAAGSFAQIIAGFDLVD